MPSTFEFDESMPIVWAFLWEFEIGLEEGLSFCLTESVPEINNGFVITGV